MILTTPTEYTINQPGLCEPPMPASMHQSGASYSERDWINKHRAAIANSEPATKPTFWQGSRLRLPFLINRRRFLQASAAVAATGALAIATDATVVEPNRPQLVRVEVPLVRMNEHVDRQGLSD